MAERPGAAVDLNDPPTDPPTGCVDPFLWQLARAKFEEHRRTAAGECVSCPRWKACPGTSLAKDGLATALGLQVRESPFWTAYAELMAGRPASRPARSARDAVATRSQAGGAVSGR